MSFKTMFPNAYKWFYESDPCETLNYREKKNNSRQTSMSVAPRHGEPIPDVTLSESCLHSVWGRLVELAYWEDQGLKKCENEIQDLKAVLKITGKRSNPTTGIDVGEVSSRYLELIRKKRLGEMGMFFCPMLLDILRPDSARFRRTNRKVTHTQAIKVLAKILEKKEGNLRNQFHRFMRAWPGVFAHPKEEISGYTIGSVSFSGPTGKLERIPFVTEAEITGSKRRGSGQPLSHLDKIAERLGPIPPLSESPRKQFLNFLESVKASLEELNRPENQQKEIRIKRKRPKVKEGEVILIPPRSRIATTTRR